jgi:DNA (cytosine-5)-methyltransferase 1
MEKCLKVIELFAGVGGFRLGLEGWNGKSSTSGYKKLLKNKIPFKVVYSNQWEPSSKRQHANEIYLERFGQEGHFDFSIDDLTNKYLKEKCDVLVGGFPCQDYSVASTLRNSKGLIGPKGILWWQIERLLDQLKTKAPNYLILENVDRLLKSPAKQRGRDFALMLKSLDNLGYNVEWRVINAAEYGLPQRRRRIFIFGSKKNSSISKSLKNLSNLEIIENKGVLGHAFPCASCDVDNDLFEKHISLNESLKKISAHFSYNFLNSGIMIDGNVETLKVSSVFHGKPITLKQILEKKNIDNEFYINNQDIKKWREHKGAKKITRTTKDGFSYNFSEGSMCFPDDLDKPSRTIITSEGGSTPSRFKHVIKDSKSYRRLLPVELERLNMFPDNFTKHKDITNSKRAFFMGNALVVGIVEKLGTVLSKLVFECRNKKV